VAGLPPLTVVTDAPPAFLPRATWVLDTVLAPLGRRVALTRDPAAGGGAAFAYAAAPLGGVPTIPCAAAAMAMLAAGEALPAGAFAVRPGAAGEAVGAFAAAPDAGFCVPFDLVASAFTLLACWDERTSGERDRFGRLPYSASLFTANPALRIEEPAVDGYVALLRGILTPRLEELGLEPLPAAGWMWGDGPASGGSAGARFAVALTHDLDNLWRWSPAGLLAAARAGARAVRHADAPALRREGTDVWAWLSHHLPHRTDPYWTFPEILGGEDARGVSSTFFVIARHTHRLDGAQPRQYHQRLPAVLDLLAAARREVALHGNDGDRLGERLLREDRLRLEQQTKNPVRGMRYHYLRCLYHETLPYLEKTGFDYDSSLAFAEHEGCRCGTSFPFHPYNLAEERPLRLLELPLAVMDTGLQGARYRALDAPTAERASRRVLERTQGAGGAVALLWHNVRFDRCSAQGYDAVYWHLVDWVRAQGGLATTAETVARRWRERTEDVST